MITYRLTEMLEKVSREHGKSLQDSLTYILFTLKDVADKNGLEWQSSIQDVQTDWKQEEHNNR